MTKINPESREDVLYLGLNVKREGDSWPHISPEEEYHLDLSLIDHAKNIAWAESAYGAELDKLREVYDNVTVLWGFHQYIR